ncbi:protein of unassigned function [Methylobacterium oryzae CBMB20]|uniref:Protein of unassigned function n=1 Tax=Methylobacterium oryzae CBMB20 TaxID=693986 RepID=A0A089NU59_9HYPH|nr:protein of unassigned function [Methylobacterium oryzae CBMB20]
MEGPSSSALPVSSRAPRPSLVTEVGRAGSIAPNAVLGSITRRPVAPGPWGR